MLAGGGWGGAQTHPRIRANSLDCGNHGVFSELMVVCVPVRLVQYEDELGFTLSTCVIDGRGPGRLAMTFFFSNLRETAAGERSAP